MTVLDHMAIIAAEVGELTNRTVKDFEQQMQGYPPCPGSTKAEALLHFAKMLVEWLENPKP